MPESMLQLSTGSRIDWYHVLSTCRTLLNNRLRQITQTSVLLIHDIMRKPNSTIVLLYIFHIIHSQKQKQSVQLFCFWGRGEHYKGLSNQADIELDMINAISAADVAFIISSSASAWLLSPLECSPQKQSGRTLRFCFWGWLNYVKNV